MKKWFALFLCMSVLIAGTACPSSDTDAAEPSPTPIDSKTSETAADGQGAEIERISDAELTVLSSNSGSGLPESIMLSYYAGQSDPAAQYFQNNRITKVVTGWVKDTIDIANPQWEYDSFTRIEILDHNYKVLRAGEALYACAFSDGESRYGYIIFRYEPTGPAMQQWGVVETTPDIYDLRANTDKIALALSETDLDLSTATASRVYLYDKDGKRADQVIRFTDANGGKYLYNFDN